MRIFAKSPGADTRTELLGDIQSVTAETYNPWRRDPVNLKGRNTRTHSVTTHTSQTAPTQYVEANGVRFAYRRLGPTNGVPVLFLQHYTGTIDQWDPVVVDGFAAIRPVIVFDNAGVGGSSGVTPNNVPEMTAHALAFIEALGLTRMDLLGFSLGGFIAQEIALG